MPKEYKCELSQLQLLITKATTKDTVPRQGLMSSMPHTVWLLSYVHAVYNRKNAKLSKTVPLPYLSASAVLIHYEGALYQV